MGLRLKKWAVVAIITAFIYFAYLMFLITWQYVPFNLEVSFLQFKEQISWWHYRAVFFTHVYTSIFILILGFFQFFSTLRVRFPRIHKNLGKAYIGLVLFLSAPSGLIMGYYGNGGIVTQFSFCLQAILWFFFTFLAFYYVKRGDYFKHFTFMVLSYALTLSAISLRLFKWIIVSVWHLPPMDTYKIVVWLGWIFNVVVAILIIARKNNKQTEGKTIA